MSTGTRSDETPLAFHYKTWTGTDDPLNKRADNYYSMRLVRGSRLAGQISSNWAVTSFLPQYPGVVAYSADFDGLQLKALADIAEKIKGHGLDVGNSIAEGRETVRSALGAISAMTRAARSVRRGDIGSALRALGQVPSGSHSRKLSTKDPGDTWLAMQYGWLPLMSDVYEAATKWEKITQPPRTFKLKSRKRNFRDTNWSQYEYLCRTESIASVEARVEISESISVPRALGLLDPVGVAWEVIPFSFVADWFIPISTYLDTLNVFQGLSATVSYTNYRTVNSSIIDTTTHGVDNFGNGIVTAPRAQQVLIAVDRTSRSPVSVPLPVVRKFTDAMSPHHILNAAALLSGALHGLRRS